MPRELNIVELIEKNPITKLSSTYNSKLLDKIKIQFTGDEQQLFIGSFYCYLNYDKNKDFVIDLNNIWQWIGFTSKFNAERLLEKHFVMNTDYKEASLLGEAVFEDDKEQVSNNSPKSKTISCKIPKQNGGQNRKIIMLTIKCFKSLCLKAQTKKANKIHEYYLKMEEMLHEIVGEETDELRLQLEQKDAVIKQKEDETNSILKQHYLENHQKFLQIYNDKKVVYIIFLKEHMENGEKKQILKIGKTENLTRRIKEIAAEFMVKEPMIIDIFETTQLLKLENRVHNHNFMQQRCYSYVKSDKKISTETYLMNDAELKDCKLIIKEIESKLHPECDIYTLEKQVTFKELELKNNEVVLKNNEIKLQILEKLEQLSLCPTTNNKKDISHEQQQMIDEIKQDIVDDYDDDDTQNQIKDDEELESGNGTINIKPRAIHGLKVPFVYQYDPNDLSTHLQKYNSPMDLQRAKPNVIPNSLRNAINNNSIYLGYRWIYVKRNETVPDTIPPTKKTVIKSHDKRQYLTQLNHNRTKILQVYTSAKSAMDNIKKHLNKDDLTCHSFNRAIKTGGLQYGFCWNYFDKCDVELQNEYLLHSCLPNYTHPLGNQIVKICSSTNAILETYNSKVEVAKREGISTKTLNKFLDTNEPYKNVIWKTM